MKPFLQIAVLVFFAATAQAQTQPIWRVATAKLAATDGFELITTDSVQFYYWGNNAAQPSVIWMDNVMDGYQAHGKIEAIFQLEKGMLFDSAAATTGLLCKQHIDGAGNVTMRNVYRDGKPKADTTVYTYTGGKMTSATRSANFFTLWHYNVQGLVDTIWKKQGSQNETLSYQYDGAGNLVRANGGIDPECGVKLSHAEYMYNTAGLVETIVRYEQGSTPQSPDTASMQRYFYNNSSQLLTRTTNLRGTGGIVQLFVRAEYEYDNAGRQSAITFYYLDFNSHMMKLGDRYAYAYSFGMPATLERQLWDDIDSKWIPAEAVQLVYALAWPVGIAQVQDGAGNIQLYPLPATGVMNVVATFSQPQPITATITDMQGRVLRTWGELSTKQYSRTISVADLPAGNYVLKLNEMAKQFVVQ